MSPKRMKAKTDLMEGPAAFERFRRAMKTIVFVHKSDVVATMPKTRRLRQTGLFFHRAAETWKTKGRLAPAYVKGTAPKEKEGQQ